jgi:hypothetical protein
VTTMLMLLQYVMLMNPHFCHSSDILAYRAMTLTKDKQATQTWACEQAPSVYHAEAKSATLSYQPLVSACSPASFNTLIFHALSPSTHLSAFALGFGAE